MMLQYTFKNNLLLLYVNKTAVGIIDQENKQIKTAFKDEKDFYNFVGCEPGAVLEKFNNIQKEKYNIIYEA